MKRKAAKLWTANRNKKNKQKRNFHREVNVRRHATLCKKNCGKKKPMVSRLCHQQLVCLIAANPSVEPRLRLDDVQAESNHPIC